MTFEQRISHWDAQARTNFANAAARNSWMSKSLGIVFTNTAYTESGYYRPSNTEYAPV